jgi:polysaccharide biosynthesis/export protein
MFSNGRASLSARAVAVAVGGILLAAGTVSAQRPATATEPPPAVRAAAAAGIVPPSDYVIGAEDVLSVLFWREKDMSVDVNVRPDGKITLPLINDIDASGLTTDQLRQKVTAAADQFIEDPSVTIIVKAINSRKVFITGQIAKSGSYPLTAPTTVVQLISMAGGVQEYADSSKIMVYRTEGGRQIARRFNYKDFAKGKNLAQNIELRPGDTVVVP